MALKKWYLWWVFIVPAVTASHDHMSEIQIFGAQPAITMLPAMWPWFSNILWQLPTNTVNGEACGNSEVENCGNVRSSLNNPHRHFLTKASGTARIAITMRQVMSHFMTVSLSNGNSDCHYMPSTTCSVLSTLRNLFTTYSAQVNKHVSILHLSILSLLGGMLKIRMRFKSSHKGTGKLEQIFCDRLLFWYSFLNQAKPFAGMYE